MSEMSELASNFQREWHDYLLSEGSEEWLQSASAEATLAQHYAGLTYAYPGHDSEEKWAKLSTTYSELAVLSQGLAQEAATREVA